MWKFLYELLVSPLGLPIDPIWEYIILLIVGEIVHIKAYSISPGGRFGSIIYWITKLIVFIIIWAILYILIFILNFIIANWILVLIISISIIALLLIFIIKKKIKKF